jgi:hypothetical protein
MPCRYHVSMLVQQPPSPAALLFRALPSLPLVVWLNALMRRACAHAATLVAVAQRATFRRRIAAATVAPLLRTGWDLLDYATAASYYFTLPTHTLPLYIWHPHDLSA